jgi:sigma-B regulation protein RsbU (phosphoserine phosphatase)
LRVVVAIPLYAGPSAASSDPSQDPRGEFLGVVYLDSQRPAAFSKLDRQILDAIAVQAASILDKARLVARERERQRMEQELSIAREIQQALLPQGLKDFPNLAVSGINFPCLGVGGDYFDVFPFGDGYTAFLIADVSGKGLGAALLTTMLQGALSGMTIGSDLSHVFGHLNRFLCDHAQVGRYATLFFGILEPEGRLRFINAGHPSPLLLRRGEVAEPFTEGTFPVGLIPEAEYKAAFIQLEPEDTLVLFSDGVTEAMDPNEELFGTTRLRDVVLHHREAPLERIQRAVLDAVESFSRGADQADDITLLLVRYRAASTNAAAA